MNDEQNSELAVQTISADGTAPKRRMATATAAWSAYWTIRNNEIQRDHRFADIAGIYLGVPPIDPSQMARNGMADMPNLNLKQFQAKIDTYCGTWNALNSASSEWAEVRMKHADPMEAERRSRYVSQCYNKALKKWDMTGFSNGTQYIFENGVKDRQMALFGVGYALFLDEITFQWKAIPSRRVLWPEGTRLCMDNAQALFIEDDMSVCDLWEKRGKKGWDEDAICSALYRRLNQSISERRYATWGEWVKQLRDNELYQIRSDFSPVSIVHVFCKEFDKSISHSIMVEQLTPTGKKAADNDATVNAFVYDRTKRAKNWREVIVPFADNSGPEGTIHGVKGFGDLIYDGCHANNLSYMRWGWSTVINNTPLFTANNEAERQKLNQIQFTFGAILMPDLTIQQIPMRLDAKSALDYFNTGTRVVDEVSRIFPVNAQTPSGEAMTATQVKFDRAEEAAFSTAQITNYRMFADVLLSEMYRRIAQPASKYPETWSGGNVAKEFREDMEAYGIPLDELLDVEYVRSNRNGGSGSAMIDLTKAKEILAIATPGQGQLNARKEIVAALKGAEMVPAFVQEEEPPPGWEDTEIDHENLFIQGGKTPRAAGYQPQEKHVQSHFALAGQIAQVVQAVMERGIQTPDVLEDAVKLHGALDAGIQHIAQHVALMSEIPRVDSRPSFYEGIIKASQKTLNDLAQLSETFGETIGAAKDKMQPQGAQQSPEMLKAQAAAQATLLKAQADIAAQEAKTQAKLGQSALNNEAKTQMKMDQHNLDMGLKAQDAVAQLEMTRAQQREQLAATAAQTGLSLEAQKLQAEQELELAKQANDEEAAPAGAQTE